MTPGMLPECDFPINYCRLLWRKFCYPQTFFLQEFIDRTGVLRYVQVGPFTSEDQIHLILDPLLE